MEILHRCDLKDLHSLIIIMTIASVLEVLYWRVFPHWDSALTPAMEDKAATLFLLLFLIKHCFKSGSAAVILWGCTSWGNAATLWRNYVKSVPVSVFYIIFKCLILFASFMSVVHLIHYTYMCCVCLSAGAGLPGAFLSVSGEAAGGFCSTEEGSGSRFGETHSSEGGRQDAAHLRQGHTGRDGWECFIL